MRVIIDAGTHTMATGAMVAVIGAAGAALRLQVTGQPPVFVILDEVLAATRAAPHFV